MAAEFAYCATPGGSGGPLTIMALLARNGVRPARGSAVFAMDQLSDLLFFLCALSGILIYALFQHLSQRMEWLLTVSALSMFGGLVSCVVVARYHRLLIRLGGRLLARLNVEPSTPYALGTKTPALPGGVHRHAEAAPADAGHGVWLDVRALDPALQRVVPGAARARRGIAVGLEFSDPDGFIECRAIQPVARRCGGGGIDVGGTVGAHGGQIHGGGGDSDLAGGDVITSICWPAGRCFC